MGLQASEDLTLAALPAKILIDRCTWLAWRTTTSICIILFDKELAPVHAPALDEFRGLFGGGGDI